MHSAIFVVAILLITFDLATADKLYKPSGLPSNGSFKKTLITAYNDGAPSVSGIEYGAYPLTIRVDGKAVKVYPAAVHGKHLGDYLYSVLKVQVEDTREEVYVHIIDMCDPKDSSCKKNIKEEGFLIDIQKSGWRAAGRSSGQLYSGGKFTYITRIGPDALYDDFNGKKYMDDWILCGCDKENCDPDDLGDGPFWCPPGDCHKGSSC